MRGESGRVAARVRDLFDETEPDRAPPAPPSSLPASPSFAAAAAASASLSPSAVRPWLMRVRRWGQRFAIRLDPGRRAAVAVGAGVLIAAVATGAWVMADRPQPLALAAGASQSSGSSSGPTSSGATSCASSSGVAACNSSSGSAGASPGVSSAATGAVENSAPSGSPAASSGAGASADPVVVDVAGKVRRPGLYRLPPGSRIDDAVRAAGGPLRGANLTSLNLAAKIVDGQQIVVGLAGVSAQDPAAAAGAGVSGGTATADGSGDAAGGSASSTVVDLNTAGSDQLQTLPGVGPVLAQHILDWRSAHGSFTSVSQLNDVPGIGEVKFAALRSLVSI